MDLLTLFLAVVLAGLSTTLATIGVAAARRYHEPRIGLVSGALALFAVVGGLGVLNELSPQYGGPFEVDPWPLGVMVLGVALIYVALVRPGPRPPTP